MKILNNKQKKQIIKDLKQFGIKEIKGILIKSGKEKIRLYTGDLSEKEISKISEITKLESVGLYFGKYHNQDLRLSIDACHLLKNQITMKIINLNQSQIKDYLKGLDIELDNPKITTLEKGFYILKYNNDLWGMGKLINVNNRIIIKNHLPKERRIKNSILLFLFSASLFFFLKHLFFLNISYAL